MISEKSCEVCGGRLHRGKRFCSHDCAYKTHKDNFSKDVTGKLELSQDEVTVENPLQVDSEFTIVAGDWHVPIHSLYWITRLLEVARWIKALYSNKKLTLVINGDFPDLVEISNHSSDRKAAAKNNLVKCAHLLDVLVQFFDEINLVQGNHDERFAKLTDNHFGFTEMVDIMKMKMESGLWENIRSTDKNFLEVNNSWVCIHPYRYRKNRTVLAVQLANHWKKNFIVAHQHHPVGFTKSNCNQYYGIDGACMLDVRKAKYVMDKMDLYPFMEVGFVLLFRKRDHTTGFRLYSEDLVDWELESSALGLLNESKK